MDQNFWTEIGVTLPPETDDKGHTIYYLFCSLDNSHNAYYGRLEKGQWIDEADHMSCGYVDNVTHYHQVPKPPYDHRNVRSKHV